MHNRPQNDGVSRWRELATAYVARRPDHPLKIRALARELGVPSDEYISFRETIRDLIEQGALALGPGRTLRAPPAAARNTGVFSASRRGFGFIERTGGADLFVGAEDTGGALNGDTVRFRFVKSKQPGPGDRAEVLEVLQRAVRTWVGVLEPGFRSWIVRAQGRDPLPDVRIDDPHAHGAKAGDLVVVEPIEHTLDAAVVRGVIVERLGQASVSHVQILGVLRRYGIETEFPPEVRAAAQRAAADFDPSDVGGRRDLRDLLTITIDPTDARDYDDAISIEPLANGAARLGVHIADVSHFVPEGGAIDVEARRRGTSIYFPGFVVPMLPETLSNGVCSLQPDQPRFARSVFIDLDSRGEPTEVDCCASVIRSAARLTYEQASAALDGGEGDLSRDVVQLLRRADVLARRIRQRRLRNGMIVLNLPEVSLRLDANGRVVDAQPEDTSFSHTIIEMFMVEANEAVARTLRDAERPFIRRVHADPSRESARSLRPLSIVLGERPPASLGRAEIGALLERVRDRPEASTVHYLLLRALPQAEYSSEDAGHFALASEAYCHFTSPIRRYPDLTVHRTLEALHARERRRGGRRRTRRDGDGAVAAASSPLGGAEAVAESGRKLSMLERRAQAAEREAKRILLLEYMSKRVGESFDGFVTGVATIGAFVQLRPVLAEGLLPLASFGNDHWVFDRDSGTMTGQRTRRVVHVGMLLRVRVVSVDTLGQQLVLAPASREPAGVLLTAGGKLRPASDGGKKPAPRKSKPRRGKRR